MKTALDQFHQEIQRVRNLIAIYDYLIADPQNSHDASDILRSCIVLGISALDAFIHDVVRIGMMQILRDERPQTQAYKGFKFTLQQIRFDSGYSWLERRVYEENEEKSFQNPHAIAQAIKHIWDPEKKDLWKEVSKELSDISEDQIKQRLKLIVTRRNQIAHEADMDKDIPIPMKRLIESKDVKENIDFIENLANVMYEVLKLQNE
jgi:hypothetical protein